MRKWRPKYLELNELWNPLRLTGLVSFQDQIFLRIATLIQFTDQTCVCNIVIWSRERNFNLSLPFWQGRGLTGLKNLGNTCYMNSIIQCISHCTLLTNFFVDGSYRWHSYFKAPDLILDFIWRFFFNVLGIIWTTKTLPLEGTSQTKYPLLLKLCGVVNTDPYLVKI